MNTCYNICEAREQPSHLVFVHGHYQCAHCGNNIRPCCEGEQAVAEETIAGKTGTDINECNRDNGQKQQVSRSRNFNCRIRTGI